MDRVKIEVTVLVALMLFMVIGPLICPQIFMTEEEAAFYSDEATRYAIEKNERLSRQACQLVGFNDFVWLSVGRWGKGCGMRQNFYCVDSRGEAHLMMRPACVSYFPNQENDWGAREYLERCVTYEELKSYIREINQEE